MIEEFRRYCALQRDQKSLATLLIYLKRNGGWVQLNRLWKELGPAAGGPFWNQTTLINKLKKLEKMEVISVDRRVLPSSRAGDKKKTNTFCKLDPACSLSPHIFSMLQVRKEEGDRFSSNLVDRPLDRLLASAEKAAQGIDPLVERELEVALELLGEVFNVDREEARTMIQDRLSGRGLVSPD
ncbi:MAG: hypothetical protein GKC10_06455 [Methanosarcinales archaeon]|nr:hypothetical protein [Methanosarcinales archaeon]